MNLFQAAVLGVVQGLSEFLPISSSGHLVIAQEFFGINQGAVIFDIFVHFATLFAVLIYFRKDILRITKNELLAIAVSSIPAALVGVFLEDAITKVFGSLLLVGFFLIITGFLNFSTERNLKKQTETKKEVGFKEAIFVGLFQAFAVLPGISRSGSTVSAGLMKNLDRKVAFRFSFLMVIPVIFGANMLHLIRFLSGEVLTVAPTALIVGGSLAFASGLLSLKVFEYIVTKAKMNIFGIYCICLGLLIVLFNLGSVL